MEPGAADSKEEFIPEPETRPYRLRLNVDAAQRFIFAGLVSDYLVGDTIKAHMREQRGQRRKERQQRVQQRSPAMRKKLKKALLTVRAMVSFKAAVKARTRSVAEAITFLKQSRFSLVTQAPALESYRLQRISGDQARQRARRQEKLQQARQRGGSGSVRADIRPLVTSMVLVATQQTRGDTRPRCMHASVALQQGLLLLGGKHPFRSDAGAEVANEIHGMSVCLLDPKSSMLVNFQPGGRIVAPRFRHTASYLRHDHATELVVVFGGKNCEDQLFGDVDVLKVSQHSMDWIPCEQVDDAGGFGEIVQPVPRYGHSAVSWEDGVIVFGGCDGERVFNDLWSMSWELRPDGVFQFAWRLLPVANEHQRPLPRQSCAIAKSGTSLYLFGGATSHDADPQALVLGDLWSYDLVTRRWQEHTTDGPRPSARCGHTCFITGDILVMYGGQQAEMIPEETADARKLLYRRATRVLSDVWMLDLRTMTWTQTLPAVGYLPCRSFHTCSPMFYNGIFMAVIMFGVDPEDQQQQVTQNRQRADEEESRTSSTSVFCLCFTQPLSSGDPASPSSSTPRQRQAADSDDDTEEKDDSALPSEGDEEEEDVDGGDDDEEGEEGTEETPLELDDLLYLASL